MHLKPCHHAAYLWRQPSVSWCSRPDLVEAASEWVSQRQRGMEPALAQTTSDVLSPCSSGWGLSRQPGGWAHPLEE